MSDVPPLTDHDGPILEALSRPADGKLTARDLLDLHVDLDAVRDAIDDVRDRVRAELEVDADRVETATGGAYNVPVKGLGRIYRTDPEAKPYVDDVDAFAAWLVDHDRDDLVDKRRTVEVRDHETAANALAAIGDDLTGELDTPEPALRHALEALVEVLRVEEEAVVAGDALERLIEHGEEPALAAVIVGDEWRVIAETGELVDGVSVRIADRRLTVKPDKAARGERAARFREAILERVPAIGPGSSTAVDS